MSEEHKKRADAEENDGSMHLDGPLGFGAEIPEGMVSGITPAVAKWIIPGIAIGIGILALCYGIAQIVTAFQKGVSP